MNWGLTHKVISDRVHRLLVMLSFLSLCLINLSLVFCCTASCTFDFVKLNIEFHLFVVTELFLCLFG